MQALERGEKGEGRRGRQVPQPRSNGQIINWGHYIGEHGETKGDKDSMGKFRPSVGGGDKIPQYLGYLFWNNINFGEK